MPRTAAAQLAFDFTEPRLPWLAAPEPVAQPCGITFPIPEPDRHGVIDFRSVLWSLRMRAPYMDGYDGYDGHVALKRDLGAWHGHAYDSLEDLPEEVYLAVDGDASAIAYPVLTGRGHWLCGGLLSCGGHDWSEMPDVLVDVGGTSREAALRGFARLRARWFEARLDARCHSGLSDATRCSATRVTDLLRAYANAA